VSALTRRLAARAEHERVRAAWEAQPVNVAALDALWSAVDAGDEVGVQSCQEALRGPLAAREQLVAHRPVPGVVRAVTARQPVGVAVEDVALPDGPVRRLGGAYARRRKGSS